MDPTKTLSNPAIFPLRTPAAERIFTHALSKLRGGRVCLVSPSGQEQWFGEDPEDTADLVVSDPRFFRRVLLGGAMAFGETHTEGWWQSGDLSALLRILSRNQAQLGPVARGASSLIRGVDKLSHALRRNTRANARRNIQEHYDLSNDLYATFLDPTLTYSAAVFADPSESLETAQLRKIDRLIDLLRPQAGQHVLEIGSGWGACAIRLAQRAGCRVTSLTLSEEQAAEARARVKAAGLDGQVEIRLQDYRDAVGPFDHLVSVEMIEAVGHEFLPTYLQACDRLLKPGGRFALQAITIPDERYPAYTRGCDWIRKHIFPGGHLPSPGLLRGLVGEHTRLELADVYEFGRDYAETLRRWHQAFLDRLDTVRALGFDERFIRRWRYYLSYCEAGFDNGLIHVHQHLYQKRA